MVKYVCKKCNKEFAKKCDYVYHTVKRKNPCTQEEKDILIQLQYKNLNKINKENNIQENNIQNNNKENFKCEFCSNYFSRKSNLLRHQKDYCKENNNNKQLEESTTNKKNLINIDDLHNMNIDNDIKQIMTFLLLQNNNLINEIHKIKDELNNNIKPSKKTINNTNTNTNTNCNNTNTTNNTTNQNTQNTLINNNSNNTINIIAHGKEDFSQIELDAIMTCLSTFKHREIIPNITKHIYLNDAKPENQNFYVTDMSRNKCKYHDGKKWLIGKSSDKITKIFDNVHNVLTDPFEKENIEKTTAFIKANPKKYNPQFIKVANHYLKSLYDDDDKESIEDKAKVLEELKLIFFNNKEEIMRIKLKDEKKKEVKLNEKK